MTNRDMLRSLDRKIATSVQQWSSIAPRFWNFLARFALYGFVLEATIFAFVLPWRPWVTLALTAVACYAVTLLVQVVIRRKRPRELPQGFKLWIHTYSFPSAHASSSFACAVLGSFAALAYVPDAAPVVIAANFLLAALIALSRVVVGVHYPSDVIAGTFLGSTLALFAVLA